MIKLMLKTSYGYPSLRNMIGVCNIFIMNNPLRKRLFTELKVERVS